MSFLPDIVNGEVIDDVPTLYRQPKDYRRKTIAQEEERLRELNNLGHEALAEDFSDSRALNK